MAEGRWLVVGLGNPGTTYAGNRHNVGAMVTDVLAGRVNARFKNHKAVADIVESRFAGARVVLAKPRSYMNLSGGATATLGASSLTGSGVFSISHATIRLGLTISRSQGAMQLSVFAA